MKERKEVQKHPFPAFYDEGSEVLILGSFPSVKSREQSFYYAHPQNRFWKVLPLLFGEAVCLETKEERLAFAKKHKIALWDVIASCKIKGSSDSSIEEVVPNDLGKILAGSKVKRIFCNGQTSYKYYRKYQEKLLGRKAEVLPSTSPANARMSLEDLHLAWSKAWNEKTLEKI